MTTTYEIYTNDGGTPKAVTGNAPAIVERVENLENAVGSIDVGVTSVNGQAGDVTVDVGVTSFNGSTGAVTYSAPVSSVNGKTGAVTVNVGVTSVNGKTGAVTGIVTSVNGTSADARGNVTVAVSDGTVTQKSTRTSAGTWSITGLTIGKPLYFIMNGPTEEAFASFYIQSGTNDSGLTEFCHGYTSESFSWSNNCSIVIPTSTSVVLNVGAVTGGTLRAYQ